MTKIIGTLAHVDAGKTTLTESMLYLTGSLRKLGRVDHGDSFLDYDTQERQRGITIYTKQARIKLNNEEIVLLDTPGHIDFSCEMERTLQVLDYAILIISGVDGIQNHTLTIWNLLKYYEIPTFIFINKMDISHQDKDILLKQLQDKLDEGIYDYSDLDNNLENIAMLDESVLNNYLDTNKINDKDISFLINQRSLVLCVFGSALKQEGIDTLVDILQRFTTNKEYSDEFKGEVFKVTYENNIRLCNIKITGGTLKTKQVLLNNEKVDQIRKYNGTKYELVEEVEAGDICTIKGSNKLNAGDSIGYEIINHEQLLTPYLVYQLNVVDKQDLPVLLKNLDKLKDEDPMLHITINNENIQTQVMGSIQIEVLQRMIQDRYNIKVVFNNSRIIYKETIEDIVEGIGHYEPLKHYSEVHLLLKPGKRNSGLEFINECPNDMLSVPFQKAIMAALVSKKHIGVLTGSEITDMKIILIGGKGHLKHTEGGDFYQATIRALRQGLKKAKSVLLEPYFKYQLIINNEYLSKAIFDIEQMQGDYTINNDGDNVIIDGRAPVRLMQNYQQDVINYTKGTGRLILMMDGYYPLDNQEVISSFNYDSQSDLDNPTDSIFCTHGAGFNVKWNEVEQYMHIPLLYKNNVHNHKFHKQYHVSDEQIEQVMNRTYGVTKTRLARDYYKSNKSETISEYHHKPTCLLVDGYNVIFAWEELNELAKLSIGAARDKLIDIMVNYQGYKQCLMIIVFDAYKVKGNIGHKTKYQDIEIVYTKEAQTADSYIERTTHNMAKEYNIIVATSDALEQLIVVGHGAKRISSRELLLDVERMSNVKLKEFLEQQKTPKNYLLENIKKDNS